MILLMRLLRGSTQYSYPQTPLEPSNQISHMAWVAGQFSLQPGLAIDPFFLWATGTPALPSVYRKTWAPPSDSREWGRAITRWFRTKVARELHHRLVARSWADIFRRTKWKYCILEQSIGGRRGRRQLCAKGLSFLVSPTGQSWAIVSLSPQAKLLQYHLQEAAGASEGPIQAACGRSACFP